MLNQIYSLDDKTESIGIIFNNRDDINAAMGKIN